MARLGPGTDGRPCTRPPCARSGRSGWTPAARTTTAWTWRREAFVAELGRAGVDDVAFELFEGTHAAIEYRYPLALGYLAERLA